MDLTEKGRRAYLTLELGGEVKSLSGAEKAIIQSLDGTSSIGALLWWGSSNLLSDEDIYGIIEGLKRKGYLVVGN